MKMVTFSCAMQRNIAPRSSSRMMTPVPPRCTSSDVGLRQPTWNIGSASSQRSPSRMSEVDMLVSCDHSMPSWLCTAPLGRPVVPEVYMIKRLSSSHAPTGGS